MSFNFAEASEKYRKAEIERDIKYKSLVAGLLREVTKYKEFESKLFPTPYRGEAGDGYIEQNSRGTPLYS